MPREATNHIRVSEPVWVELNKRKRPGDTFDDVLQRLLTDDSDEEQRQATAD